MRTYIGEESFTSEGSTFFVGFFGNFNPNSATAIDKVRFAVDSISGDKSTVFVQSIADGGNKPFDSPFEVEFPARLINLRGSNERNKGIRIYSKDGDPISVVALAEEIQSADAFKVLPCIYQPSNGYEYYAVSVAISRIVVPPGDDADQFPEETVEFSPIEGRSALVIVTTEDDTTLLITPTQPIELLADDLKNEIPNELFQEGGQVRAGQTISITLSKEMQTLYLASDDDLSGSRIVSDKPISFFSGHECGTVPSNITYCDQMNEQIPPTSTWGREFISAPLANRTSGDTFKIVASRNNTAVDVTCTNGNPFSMSLTEGEVQSVVIASDDSCYFVSSQPILLVQFSMSSNVDRVFLSDPFMVVVPPVEQYRSRYNIHSFRSSVSVDDEIGFYFLNVLVPSSTNLDGILLDDEPVLDGRFQTDISEILCLNSERICAYSISIEGVTESGVLRHRRDLPFNAIVYWYDFRVGYGYFAGMTQRPIARKLHSALHHHNMLATIVVHHALFRKYQ